MRARAWMLLIAAASLAAGCPLEPLEGPPACAAGECDDANGCTIDRCDDTTGRCVFDAMPRGALCDDDADACNGLGECDAFGRCELGAPPAIDDGDECTADSCDGLTGVVSHVPIDGCTPSGGGGGGGGGAPPDPSLWTPIATQGAPSSRHRHTAIWTGGRMIVWGGLGPKGVTNTGAIYDPTTDTWSPTAVANAPSARHSHSAVWTGSEMIVWGGYSTTYESTGARYNPATDTWTPLPYLLIRGRARHAAVWTGNEMIVWGGSNGISPLGDGARYSLAANTWSALPAGGPSARFNVAAGWTGTSLVIWGGTDTFDWLSDGRYYNPSLNSWSAVSTTNRPSLRESPSVAWTGSGLLVWGGWNGGDFLEDGALLKPGVGAGGTWSMINVALGAAPRVRNVTAWTGNELCVWGGCGGDDCGDIREDGGCYSVTNDAWHAIPADVTFQGRVDAASVWTGSEILVFGGARNGKALAGGARVSPSSLLP